MRLAEAHRARGNEERAVLEMRAVDAILEEIAGLRHERQADSARDESTHQRSSTPELHAFRLEGDYWSVTFEGQTVRVRDIKGMRYLARLLAAPGREFHVLDLVAILRGEAIPSGNRIEAGALSSEFGDSGEMLDQQAKDAYRRRLAEIDDDLQEAEAGGDAVRAAQAEAEREFLLAELSRAVGLGGRDRRAGSASERARASVTRAVRQAMARIREHHPPLGEHLDRAIRTGTYCSYLPDPRARVSWQF
jgi:hypothetical protein